MTVQVRRISLPADQAQQFLVLEAYVDGVPSVTKRMTVMLSALVSRPELLAQSQAKLEADVTQYHANYLALQNL